MVGVLSNVCHHVDRSQHYSKCRIGNVSVKRLALFFLFSPFLAVLWVWFTAEHLWNNRRNNWEEIVWQRRLFGMAFNVWWLSLAAIALIILAGALTDLGLWLLGKTTITDYLRAFPDAFWVPAVSMIVLIGLLAFHLFIRPKIGV